MYVHAKCIWVYGCRPPSVATPLYVFIASRDNTHLNTYMWYVAMCNGFPVGGVAVC